MEYLWSLWLLWQSLNNCWINLLLQTISSFFFSQEIFYFPQENYFHFKYFPSSSWLYYPNCSKYFWNKEKKKLEKKKKTSRVEMCWNPYEFSEVEPTDPLVHLLNQEVTLNFSLLRKKTPFQGKTMDVERSVLFCLLSCLTLSDLQKNWKI